MSHAAASSHQVENLNSPKPWIVAPKSKHTHTAILLHGLGSSGEKFGEELLRTGTTSSGLSLSEIFSGMKFIFLTAQKRRSSAFKRATINQWFDKASVDDPYKRRELQIEGLAESANEIMRIAHEESKLVPAHNIIIGGLSQGCAMAFFVLLSCRVQFGAFVGMSGYLPFCPDIKETMDSCQQASKDDYISFGDSHDNSDEPLTATVKFVHDILSIRALGDSEQVLPNVPVFLGHGEDDERINCNFGKEAAGVLASLGFAVTWKSYSDTGHWYKVPDEINDVVVFLKDKMAF